MQEKQIHTLNIDEQFRNLIPPLSAEEKELLELNIINGGCREPLCVWNNTIIDGHNRYDICLKHNIPFYIQPLEFKDREEAIDWICANQLGRRNISLETRKYLIGKRYEMEKIISKKCNPHGRNQYSPPKVYEADTASRLGEEYNIARGTVRKYAYYSRTVDKLSQKNPELIPDIMSGKIKISHESVAKLGKKHTETIKKIKNDPSCEKGYLTYSDIKRILPKERKHKEETIKVKVKETPVYDPDADISSLTFTIPSWISSIERTFSLVDFNKITPKARTKIRDELNNLKSTIDIMLEATEVKDA